MHPFLSLIILLGLFVMCHADEATVVKEKKKNHLKDETSPYLLQHVYNPVDWYPWGEEAFAKAKKENKPIFLSIGYSSCHWCHVMEKESFENEEIAKILNEHFVCVKVDREERPDVDKIYMEVVRMITGSGGWPMTIFMTHDRKPFFAGTYFPPEDAYNRMGFKKLINKVAEGWVKENAEITTSAEKVVDELKKIEKHSDYLEASIEKFVFEKAFISLKEEFDAVFGGFGGAPKFPNTNAMRFLLRYHYFTGNKESLEIAEKTLSMMSNGGMYDQLGGGFHRYSVDEKWLVPHFEKMLYDNAQLVTAYAEAYQVTGNLEYKRVVIETLDSVLGEFKSKEGGFYSSYDADSEHKEGVYYLWSMKELKELLSQEEVSFLTKVYGLSDAGNFTSHETYHKGLNIFHTKENHVLLSKGLNLSYEDFEKKLNVIKSKLIQVRSKRVAPSLDDKINCAWNGLMISGFCKSYEALGDKRYKTAAVNAADFVLEKLYKEELFKTYRAGQVKHKAVLDDYAYFVSALLSLYQISFDEKYILKAIELQVLQNKHFLSETGTYNYAHSSQTDLLIKMTPSYDDAIPNANSVSARNLLTLWMLTGEKTYYDQAEKLMKNLASVLGPFPKANLHLLEAWSIYLEDRFEVVVASDGDSLDSELLRDVQKTYMPNRVIAFKGKSTAKSVVVILEDKVAKNGEDLVYLCKGLQCLLPMKSWSEALEVLKKSK